MIKSIISFKIQLTDMLKGIGEGRESFPQKKE